MTGRPPPLGRATAPPVRVTVNGEPMAVDPGTTVEGLVAAYCPNPQGVAVAVDREVIARSLWGRTEVPEGAAVEIVTAAAGG